MAPFDPASKESDPAESEERLAQVRDLLFGDTARTLEDRLAELAGEVDRKTAGLAARAEALEVELQALRAASVDKQSLAASLRALADAVESKLETDASD